MSKLGLNSNYFNGLKSLVVKNSSGKSCFSALI